MKRKTTLTILTLFASIHMNAQWVAVGTGMDNYVWGSAVYNGNLYACGNFEHADGNPALAIAKWNGSAWSDVGGGFQTNPFSNVVRGLIVFNGELYAGGYVDSVGGMPIHKVAKWNGTTWSAAGMDCPISTVNCFAVHNGELYAGGQGSGAVKVSVAKWTGSSWLALDTEGVNTDVNALISYNGNLYAGGGFSTFNGATIGGVARWNGSSWSDIGSGFSAFNVVKALAVFNGKLYIGGGFTTAGGISANNIVSWDETTWSALAGGVNSGVQSLLVSDNKLFVGGIFWMVNSVTANRAAYWDGSSWSVLGTDLGAGARTEQVYNNELYYFGEGAFNGQSYAARWSGGTFTGIHEDNVSLQGFSVYPNPSSGKFFLNTENPTQLKSIAIYNVIGEKVREKIISSDFVDEIKIDVSAQPKGIYLMKIKTESGDCCKRIVVE